MRKIFLTILIILTPQICSAPVLDFRLNMLRFLSVTGHVRIKFHESEFSRFVNDLGHRESGNNWLSVNRIGCFGEWQFAESTLKYLGFRHITLKKFKANPNIFPKELQLKALMTLIEVNQGYLEDYEHYIGHSIIGIEITRAGMIAASHLGGAGSLKKFLDSNGKINKKDIFGTSIHDYLYKFSNYELE